MVLLFNTIYISVDLAHHEIFRAEVDKCGINGGANSRVRIAILHRFINFSSVIYIYLPHLPVQT